MRLLFPIGGSLEDGSLEDGARVGVRDVWLVKNPNTVSFSVVLPAVAASGCVRRLNVMPEYRKTKEHPDLPVAQRRLWWWLAYGLFRKPQTSGGYRLQHLRLSMTTFHEQALPGFADALHAVNPLAVIFGRGNPDDVPETVSASQFALLDPATKVGGRLPRWSADEPIVDLPVVERTKKCVCVLLPYWGQAWVHADYIVATNQAEPSQVQIQCIPRISLVDAKCEDTELLIAFLRLVGNDVRYLGIRFDKNEGAALGDLFSRIFECCPNLECLKVIGAGVGSSRLQATLQPFVEAFATGACRLKRLHLFGISFADANLALKTFVDALNDPHHPAWNHLKELTVNGLVMSIMSEAIVDSCLKMLNNNSRLDRFALSFSDTWPPIDEQLATCYDIFKDFDNQLVHHTTPATKLAFLSVVTQQSGQGDQCQALKDLDVQAISLIFQFAASSHRRRVLVAT